jgi:hypothetical protein
MGAGAGGFSFLRLGGENDGFVQGNGDLLQGTVGQPDLALVALGYRVRGFQGNRQGEVSRKGHLPTNW